MRVAESDERENHRFGEKEVRVCDERRAKLSPMFARRRVEWGATVPVIAARSPACSPVARALHPPLAAARARDRSPRASLADFVLGLARAAFVVKFVVFCLRSADLFVCLPFGRADRMASERGAKLRFWESFVATFGGAQNWKLFLLLR